MLLFFGGSFDPIHIGHLILARDVMEHFGYQKVIFIPTYLSPFKENHGASSQDRVEMLKLAIHRISQFDIETYEVEKKGKSYTIETVFYLLEKYNLQKVDWLMGDDTFLSLHRWHRAKELLSYLNPVVVLRRFSPKEVETYRKKILGLENLKLYNARRLDISSTEIRNRVKKGLDISFLVPWEVEEYIKKKGLYR
ncbi:MAG TPA: nicotinate (nicotinamide) nucleotide adenylyltransferase [Aquificales bacterium]|nr:nicotinate (nicotinamide) nucleotide adenylyltransferase [Aquificales bacterium]